MQKFTNFIYGFKVGYSTKNIYTKYPCASSFIINKLSVTFAWYDPDSGSLTNIHTNYKTNIKFTEGSVTTDTMIITPVDSANIYTELSYDLEPVPYYDNVFIYNVIEE